MSFSLNVLTESGDLEKRPTKTLSLAGAEREARALIEADNISAVNVVLAGVTHLKLIKLDNGEIVSK